MMTTFRLLGVTLAILAILAISSVASARDAGERTGPVETAPVVQAAAPLFPPLVPAAAAAEIALPAVGCEVGLRGRNALHRDGVCVVSGVR